MQVLDRLDRDAIQRLLDGDEFFWLDLESPPDGDVAALGDLLGVHRMAVEDSLEFGQRPKLDEYGDRVLLVFFAVDGDDAVEVHVHVSGSWIVTLRRQRCPPLDIARRRLQGGLARTEEEVVYRVLDPMADSFFPLVERLGDAVDDLEDAMLAAPSQDERERLFALRRDLGPLRRIVAQQRDVMVTGGDLIARLPGFQADVAHDYFRDIYDHLIRVAADLDGLRDRLTAATELLLSNQSNRLNQVMKQLTVIATVFLPLTFVTGFFGQNFGWMVRNVDTEGDFIVLGIGGVLVSGLALGVYFWRAGFYSK